MKGINTKSIICLTLLAVFISISAVSADTPITGPTTITDSGDYYLANDFTCPSGNAIVITSGGVTIDGQGHTIDGLDTGANGISCQLVNGVTIHNMTIQNFNHGIDLYFADINCYDNILTSNNVGIYAFVGDSSTIRNNVISSNDDSGIYFDFTWWASITENDISSNNNAGIYFAGLPNVENYIENNAIVSNGNYGIYLENSHGNYIYHNFLNNEVNAYVATFGYSNIWSTSAETGGGNYWLCPDGSGWSQTTPDADNDGYCDLPKVIDGYNVDLLPIFVGNPIEVYTLVIGDGTPVGTLTTHVAEDLLYFTYEISDHNMGIGEIHLMALDESPEDTESRWFEDGYLTKTGNPKPGKFEINEEFDVCTYKYSGILNLTEIEVDSEEPLYITAHATLCDGSALESTDGIWVNGTQLSGKNWAMYVEYPLE